MDKIIINQNIEYKYTGMVEGGKNSIKKKVFFLLSVVYVLFFLFVHENNGYCYLPKGKSPADHTFKNGMHKLQTDTTGQQELTLDDLLSISIDELMKVKVRSAGLVESDLQDISGYAYVIQEHDILYSGARNLEDVTNQFVPGSIVGRHHFTGSLHGVRGLLVDNNAKTLVMVDGQNINQRCFWGYNNGFQNPLIGDISRIEFINGPGAIVHGSGAINGIINMIPKNGEQNEGVEINTSYGSTENYVGFETGYGHSYGKDRNIYLYGGIATAKGYPGDENEFDFDFSGIFSPDLRNTLIDSVLAYPIHNFEKPSLRFSINWQHGKLNLNSFFFSHHSASNTYVHPGHFRTRTFAVRPKYILELTQNELLEFYLSGVFTDDNFYRLEMQGEVVNTGEIFQGGGREMHLQSKMLLKSNRFDNAMLAAGSLIGKRKFDEEKQFFSSALPYNFNTVNTDWTEVSVFTENTYQLSDKILIFGGLRYDISILKDIHGQDLDNQQRLSPLVAISYSLNKTTFFKLKYQTGFRYPDAGYYNTTKRLNEALEDMELEDRKVTLSPEYLNSTELNIINKFTSSGLQMNFSFFHNNFHNTLTYMFYEPNDEYLGLTPDQLDHVSSALSFPAGSMNNLKDKFTTYGGEIFIRFSPLKPLYTGASYSLVQFNNIEDPEINYPRHLIKLNAESQLFTNKLVINLNALYHPGFDIKSHHFHEIYGNNQFLLNGVITYRMTKFIRLQLTGRNILKSKVPPLNFGGTPNKGGLGFNKRFFYITLNADF